MTSTDQRRPTVTPDEPRSARQCLDAARDALLAMRQSPGYWKGELETNVTMDAEDILLRHFLGILDEKTLTGAADRIRSQQRRDGPWATFHGCLLYTSRCV